VNVLVRPLELAWRGVNRLRRGAYRRGWLSPRRLPRPVISVGSVAAGGAGKTPTTIAVTRILVAEGLRVVVLTRGYGRGSGTGPAIVDGSDPDRFGDEPVLIHEAVPEADVVVGADRWSSGTWYLGSRECDVFVLDDGFQHLQLARDADLVIDHACRGWQRESRSALRFADAVLVRGEPTGTIRGRPTFRVDLRPEAFLTAGEVLPPEWIRSRPVVAFAGLADNAQFFQLLASLGADLHMMRGFADHYRYTSDDMSEILELASHSPDALLVTTEKDRVKLRSMDLVVLRVGMKIEPIDEFRDLVVGIARGHRS